MHINWCYHSIHKHASRSQHAPKRWHRGCIVEGWHLVYTCLLLLFKWFSSLSCIALIVPIFVPLQSPPRNDHFYEDSSPSESRFWPSSPLPIQMSSGDPYERRPPPPPLPPAIGDYFRYGRRSPPRYLLILATLLRRAFLIQMLGVPFLIMPPP